MKMLNNGTKYQMKNMAVGGTTAMKSADNPYTKTYQYTAITKIQLFKPDIVFIMFGTNDAKYVNGWNEKKFIKEY